MLVKKANEICLENMCCLTLKIIYFLSLIIISFLGYIYNFIDMRYQWIYRSSHQRCSMKNFAKFTGKHPCQSLFFNKVTGLRPATLFKKSLWHRCFPVNFAKFLRVPFLQNTSGRLLLNLVTRWGKIVDVVLVIVTTLNGILNSQKKEVMLKFWIGINLQLIQLSKKYGHSWKGRKIFSSSKFYIRRNNNNADSIETGRIVIANLLP